MKTLTMENLHWLHNFWVEMKLSYNSFLMSLLGCPALSGRSLCWGGIWWEVPCVEGSVPAGWPPPGTSTLAGCAHFDATVLAPAVCLSNGSFATWERKSHPPWACVHLSVFRVMFACPDLGSLSHEAFYSIQRIVLKRSWRTKSKQEKNMSFGKAQNHFKVTNTSVKANDRAMHPECVHTAQFT